MTRKVAIACQGGGSHTAFAAGVLKGLLPALPDHDLELVGLSGTSGGAISALTAWYALLDGGVDTVPDRLDSLWADIAARRPGDRLLNEWLVGLVRAQTAGAPIPTVSPYRTPVSERLRRQLRQTVERHVDFEVLPDLVGSGTPRMVVGTVNVNGGTFETFVDDEITSQVVMASAAVPDLFEAVEMNGHWHWDGLFSENPPVRDLLDGPIERKPDELWVVQVNPQTRAGEPTTLVEIADRRNELSGNLFLNQQVRFVETVNEWLAAGLLSGEQYKHIDVRRLEFGRELTASTKFDRDPEFVEGLLEEGVDRAEDFLAAL